LKSY
jgi:hypothetical protein